MTTKTKKTKPAAPKLDPDVFLRAAELIDDGVVTEFSCTAILIAFNQLHGKTWGYPPEREAYCELYQPDAVRLGYDAYTFFHRPQYKATPEKEAALKERRLWALCFAYELARRGELPL